MTRKQRHMADIQKHTALGHQEKGKNKERPGQRVNGYYTVHKQLDD